VCIFYIWSYWTHLQDQGRQVVQLSATRYLSITIFQFSLVSFAMVILCVVSHQVLIIVRFYILAVICDFEWLVWRNKVFGVCFTLNLKTLLEIHEMLKTAWWQCCELEQLWVVSVSEESESSKLNIKRLLIICQHDRKRIQLFHLSICLAKVLLLWNLVFHIKIYWIA
jgi:hypothetical protein